MSNQRVALDTDFISYVTGIQDSDPADFFCRLFQALNQTPVVHPYIAELELMHNPVAQQLMDSGKLTVIRRSEFLLPGDDIVDCQYRHTFTDLYSRVTGRKTLSDTFDIWTSHAQMSLGEIHTILMAAIMQIPIFYSNDGGAKRGASYYRAGRLRVYTAEDVAEQLVEAELVTGKERRFLKHYRSRPI